MLEQYLSSQLNKLELQIKEAQQRIEENSIIQTQSANEAKELNAKLDPSMEVFSPLKVNDSIKKGIRLANEQIDKAKTDIETDKAFIDTLENERINLVSMLADFRQSKYKLQRYENCNFPTVLSELQQKLSTAQEQIVNSELEIIHKECLQLINDCMNTLISRNK